jgi:hypothetical protein
MAFSLRTIVKPQIHAGTKYSRIPTTRACLLLLAIVSTLSSFNIAPANGAGPNFVLSPLPTRIQEGAAGGVKLVLNVTNAIFPSAYNFIWTVTDPAGTARTSTNSTASNGPSWSVSTNYPSAFGASANLVGIYKINVTETVHSLGASVATGQFQVGLTDSASYQRTVPVLIRASGYIALENVTINLTQGSTSVPTFPTIKKADTNGQISLTWQTAVGTPLGNYLVTISGATTPAKTPPDLQIFTVYPTNVTISGLWLNGGSIERSQTLEFRFNASYLNGSLASSGTAKIRITEPNGSNHTITASYDSSLQTFRAFYVTTLGSTTGVWIGTIDLNSFDDGLNNGGPLSPVFTNFNIRPASLIVSAISYNATYPSGTILPIYARISTPSAASFTQGTVTATIASSGRKIIGPLSLGYDPSRGEWSGSYKINETDPSGTWVVTITASDGYGNAGQNSASLSVNTTGAQNPAQSILSSWAFWLLVLALIVIGFGILMMRFRGVSHREVKLDVQAIKHQADQVKGDDFLQSIQAQLKRRAEKIAAEKEKHD